MIKTLMQLIDDRTALEFQIRGGITKREDLVLVVGPQVYTRVKNDSTADRSYFKPGTPDTLAGVEIGVMPVWEGDTVTPDPFAVVLAKRSALYGA